MFGVSISELAVVLVVALLVFGPEKLPEIASQLGKLSSQLKRASDGFRREFYNSVYTPVKEESNSFHSELLAPKSLSKLKDDLTDIRSDVTSPTVISSTETSGSHLSSQSHRPSEPKIIDDSQNVLAPTTSETSEK